MIIHEERERLITVIEKFMDGETRFEELLEEIAEMHSATGESAIKDETVVEIIEQLTLHFGLMDFPQMNRYTWKLLNRYRLILASDAEFVHLYAKRYTVRQGISLLLLLGAIVLAVNCFVPVFGTWFTKNGPLIFVGYYLFLTISWLLMAKWEQRSWQLNPPWPETQRRRLDEGLFETYPFESLGEIVTLRRNTPGFQCRKYRPPVEKRSVWKKLYTFLTGWMDVRIHVFPQWLEKVTEKVFGPLILFVIYLIFTPFIMLVNLFPESRSETRLELHDHTTFG